MSLSNEDDFYDSIESNNRNRTINTPITDYKSLLSVAKQQPEPQRLLFVFLQASLSDDAKNKQKQQFDSGQGGELQPVMCVDKNLDELGGFADLVEESKQMQQDWQIVLVAGLSGKNGHFPDSSEAEQPLNMMVQAVEQSGDLSKYLAFDKQGALIHFS